MKELVVNLSEIINIEKTYYAHIKEKKESKKENNSLEETLEEHSNLVRDYGLKMIEKKKLENIFNKFLKKFLNGYSDDGKNLGKELCINTIYLHDVGKVIPEFQRIKMKKNIEENPKSKKLGSKHSIVSSVIYIDYFIKKIENIEQLEFEKEKRNLKKDLTEDDEDKIYEERVERLYLLLYINAYIISRHHSNLDSFNDFINLFYEDNDGTAYRTIKILRDDDLGILKNKINLEISEGRYSDIETAKDIMESLNNEEKIYLYTYERLLYSILLAADFYSTSEFMNGVKIKDFGCIDDIEEFYKIYKDTGVYKSIREYEKKKYKEEKDLENEKDINVLRTEMFLDAERALEENKEGEIYYLEAPTGAGKSNVGINLSFKLIKENEDVSKIYYVYPFNTLVEQNEENLTKIFGENKEILNKIVTVNSLNPIKVDNNVSFEEEFKKYSKALLDRQFLNYPFILTTHVSIFNTMFGREKEEAFSFFQLANSVILLDEIQSYKISIWPEIISFFKVFAKLLNIKIIIMSATLPNLEVLTDLKGKTVNLISNREKYFNNKIFKDRVEVDDSLLGEGKEALIEHIKEISKGKKKILVEFISKKSAYEIYEVLKEAELESEIYLLTGDDNSIDRNNIIEAMKAKGKKDTILIATQVIEAGVDIDMDIGYKDISKLDSEEQFMGRVNRSCKRKGKVYFFNLDNETGIYKNDVRTRKSLILESDEMKNILIDKTFGDYYSKVLNLLKEKSGSSDMDKNLNEFIKEIGLLNFIKVSERMKLIDEENMSISVYLGRKILDKDKKEIDGNTIWEEYVKTLKDNEMEFSKKQVKLSEIKSKMNYFIYQIKKNSSLTYTEIVGELYYIEDGEKYFNDGRVDKEKLNTGIGDFI